MSDFIDRQAAIDAMWKALYDYEDKTEKQFQESDELDVDEWIVHRIFVQNMNDIDRRVISDLPSADVAPVRHGRWKWQDDPARTFHGWPMCSECGAISAIMTPYCCVCGAKMDERGEDE